MTFDGLINAEYDFAALGDQIKVLWEKITTDGGVNVSILYVPLEAAPHHEYVQVTMFDYFLLDEGRYQMTIRPTENLRAFTWYRP